MRALRPEGAELSRRRGSLPDGPLDLGEGALDVPVVARQIDARLDDEERVVEVVRDAPREPAEDLELARLLERALARAQIVGDPRLVALFALERSQGRHLLAQETLRPIEEIGHAEETDGREDDVVDRRSDEPGEGHLERRRDDPDAMKLRHRGERDRAEHRRRDAPASSQEERRLEDEQAHEAERVRAVAIHDEEDRVRGEDAAEQKACARAVAEVRAERGEELEPADHGHREPYARRPHVHQAHGPADEGDGDRHPQEGREHAPAPLGEIELETVAAGGRAHWRREPRQTSEAWQPSERRR